ncbi:MAG: hypothetical protein ACFFD2_04425 [Promethearchaeota archaeon]
MLCSKYTRILLKSKVKNYPIKRKLWSANTIKKLNIISFYQNQLQSNQKRNKFIPNSSPKKEKYPIIHKLKDGTNNYENNPNHCIGCHFHLYQEEFQPQRHFLEVLNNKIFKIHEKKQIKINLRTLNRCEKAKVRVYY